MVFLVHVVALSADLSFERMAKLKALLDDPNALAAAAAAAAKPAGGAAPAAGGAAAATKVEKVRVRAVVVCGCVRNANESLASFRSPSPSLTTRRCRLTCSTKDHSCIASIGCARCSRLAILERGKTPPGAILGVCNEIHF
jgi:hypothetical protein